MAEYIKKIDKKLLPNDTEIIKYTKEEIFIFNDYYLIISSVKERRVIFKIYENKLMILENGCWKVYKKGFSEIDTDKMMYDLEKLNLSSYKCLPSYPYIPNLTKKIC